MPRNYEEQRSGKPDSGKTDVLVGAKRDTRRAAYLGLISFAFR